MALEFWVVAVRGAQGRKPMAKKSKSAQPISTHMQGNVSSMKQGKSRDMAKGPRKYAKGEVTNEVSRPPKH